MKMTKLKSALLLLLSLLLVAAMAVSIVGCNNKDTESSPVSSSDASSKVEEIGKGKTSFYFTVVHLDKSEKSYLVKTDKTTVGEALSELSILKDNDNGLYKTVDNVTLDYEKDKKYWAFYVNNEYGMEGADTTEIEEGATYAFKAE